mmetsp:Transcript_59310/g.190824  ORF Transcript_59310/g.190824 Transcript_59310/m.190824 type:complete len:313 (-) Transcript_59310:2598-3536(-)
MQAFRNVCCKTWLSSWATASAPAGIPSRCPAALARRSSWSQALCGSDALMRMAACSAGLLFLSASMASKRASSSKALARDSASSPLLASCSSSCSSSSCLLASLACKRRTCSAALPASTSSRAVFWLPSWASSSDTREAAFPASAAAACWSRTICAWSSPLLASLAFEHSSLYLFSTSALCTSCRWLASSASELAMRAAVSACSDAIVLRCSSSCPDNSSHSTSKTWRRCLPSSTALARTSSFCASVAAACALSSRMRSAVAASADAAASLCPASCSSKCLALSSASWRRRSLSFTSSTATSASAPCAATRA